MGSYLLSNSCICLWLSLLAKPLAFKDNGKSKIFENYYHHDHEIRVANKQIQICYWSVYNHLMIFNLVVVHIIGCAFCKTVQSILTKSGGLGSPRSNNILGAKTYTCMAVWILVWCFMLKLIIGFGSSEATIFGMMHPILSYL